MHKFGGLIYYVNDNFELSVSPFDQCQVCGKDVDTFSGSLRGHWSSRVPRRQFVVHVASSPGFPNLFDLRPP